MLFIKQEVSFISLSRQDDRWICSSKEDQARVRRWRYSIDSHLRDSSSQGAAASKHCEASWRDSHGQEAYTGLWVSGLGPEKASWCCHRWTWPCHCEVIPLLASQWNQSLPQEQSSSLRPQASESAHLQWGSAEAGRLWACKSIWNPGQELHAWGSHPLVQSSWHSDGL